MVINYIKIYFNWGLGIGDWGLGIGDWGLGIGDWANPPIPNPQSPIPNPHIFLYIFNFKKLINYFKLFKYKIIYLFF